MLKRSRFLLTEPKCVFAGHESRDRSFDSTHCLTYLSTANHYHLFRVPKAFSPDRTPERFVVGDAARNTPTANDFQEWDAIETCFKMIDEIQQMQGLSIEVLNRMTDLAVEIRKVAEELDHTAVLIQRARQVDPRSRSGLTTTLTKTASTDISSIQQAAKPGFLFDDDELFDQHGSSYEYDAEYLEKNVRPTMVLHSLKATGNVSERRNRVIQHTLQCLGKTSLPPPPRRKAPAGVYRASAQGQTPGGAPLADDRTQDGNVASPNVTQATQQGSVTKVAAPGKPSRPRRKTLPSVQQPSERISFAALGRMILQRTGVPITHYEPLTAIQLLCDELRSVNLLEKACSKTTPEEKMVYVSAFAISPYLNSCGRFRKFFNPLLGETYEYEQEEFRYHGEQVAHHPPVSAGHAVGNGWILFQTFSAEIAWNAWAQTCEFMPERPVRLELTGDHYSWNKITSTIENLMCVPEERKFYHEGTINVKCSNGVSASLNVKKNREVFGEVIKSTGESFCKLIGKWDDRICSQKEGGFEEPLLVVDRSAIRPEYFGFTDYTMGLNELRPEDRDSLPPTDSRFRPDVRCLEEGKLDEAVACKGELEQAQRARAIDEETYKPLWFIKKHDEFSGADIYVTTGKYWEAKEAKFAEQKKNNAFIPIFNISITN
ncbi:hypothetical protein Q1695_011647 [Nippostrongylus brasiliensis]|nr:hypothetical protein Q1695_011647 [Nippostrongylus brasiliensis]